MYESFYGLSANPFRLVPDARFYFDGEGHKRGMAYLRYGLLQGQGFVVVTGKPGTGKSTLVEALFSEMPERSLVVANLVSTNLDADEILQAVAHCFGIATDGKNKAALLNAIESFLRARTSHGKRVILIADEAQNLPPKSLEELRMLSNFQQQGRPLLQIILLGQHQLNDMLACPDMEQLCQRVIASCHLDPLSAEQMRAYIAHRLQCAGWHGKPSISSQALGVIYAVSGGVPRLINIFCDRLFLSASLDGMQTIDLALAQTVQEELKGESTGSFCGLSLNKGDHLIELDALPDAEFVAAVEQAQDDEKDKAAEPAVAAAEIHDEQEQESLAFRQVDDDVAEHESAAVGVAASPSMQSSEIGAEDENIAAELDEDLPVVATSTSLQVERIDPVPVFPNPGPLTAAFAYKEIKPSALSETPASEANQTQANIEEMLQDYLPAQDDKTESNNRGFIWPPVFVGVAMVIMFFFAEDVRDFSQRYTFPDIDLLAFVKNAPDAEQSEENLELADASAPVFVHELPQSKLQSQGVLLPVEAIDIPTESSEMWDGDEASVDLAEADKIIPAIPSISEMEGYSALEAQTDFTSPQLAEAAPEAELSAETSIDHRLDKQEPTPAPVKVKPETVTPVVAKEATSPKSKPKPEKVASVAESAPKEPNKPVPVVKAPAKTPEPAQAEIAVEEPEQTQDEAAIVAMENDAADVDVIIPKFDDTTAVGVLPAKAISDLEGNSLETAASTDLPPVVEVSLAQGGITEFELMNLLYDLVAYYEAGNLSDFVGLFTPDAVVDGVRGRHGIRRDYQALFDATDIRQMQLDTLQWQNHPEYVEGSGEFAVTVWRKRGRPSITQKGILKLGVVKHGEVLAIKTMAHELK